MYEPEALKKDIERCDSNVALFEGILKRETELHFSTEDKSVFDRTGENMKIYGKAIIEAHQEKEALEKLLREAEN